MTAILILAATRPLFAANVWSVDDDQPADFSDLQTAVLASGEGDILLLKPGVYPGVPHPTVPGVFNPVEIVGKSLTLIADAGGAVVLQHGLWIRDLAAHQKLYVRGLDFEATGLQGLRGEDCSGVLWVEDCRLPSGSKGGFPPARVEFIDCDAVNLQRCDIDGIDAFEGLTPGEGLELRRSQLALYDCNVTGGSGNAAITNGAAALSQVQGFVLASGCSFVGGEAGFLCEGPGIRINGSQAELKTVDCTIAAGTPGLCSPVPAVEILAGSWTPLSAASRCLEITSPVRDGQSATLDVTGIPGDLVLLHFAPGSGFAFVPSSQGVLQLQPAPLGTLILGFLGGTGQLSLTATVGPVPLGIEGLLLAIQATHAQPGGLVLGGGSLLVALEAGTP
jgi:hypothetical protein